MKGHEKPILFLFEELNTNDQKFIASNRHHLNNLIGEQEWIQLHKMAIETDKELAILNG